MTKRNSIILILLFFQFGFTQTNTIKKQDVSKSLSDATKYFRNFEFDKSLEIAKKSLRDAYKIGDNVLIARAYNIIALNFEEFSDYNKAIHFYEKGLKYADKTQNDTIKYWLHGNLGNIYCYRNIDYKKGLEEYKKGLVYLVRLNDEIEIMYANLNIAGSYFEIGKFKEGLKHLNNAKATVYKTKEVEALIAYNSILGGYYSYLKQYKNAEKYFEAALDNCNKDLSKHLDGNIMDLYKDVSEVYFKNKKYDKAYLYLNKHDSLQDIDYNKERVKILKTAGLHIEIEEAKREIEEIETDRNLQVQNLKQTKTVVLLFVIIFLGLLLLLYSIYRNHKLKNRINFELARKNLELKTAKVKAEEANNLKSQFVSTITHELRTPLYGVVGITNMIVDEHKELANSPYLNSLKFSAKYLLSLVNDVLQINKIEENKIILEEMAFNVSDEINSIVNSLQFIAEKNKNKLSCIVDKSIPEYLIGDKLRLSQIFMNLISNALKFTKKGEVIVSADLVKVENNINYIKFQVKDNGVGIAKEDQDKIFEKFVQVGRKEEDYQGTGLGLPIVKKLIELFGSQIQLESEEGQGTTFTFTIGFEEDNDKLNKFIGEFDVDLTSTQVYKVLVVEDNMINQLITQKILDNNNFNSLMVNDGIEAIKILKNETFDIILMDINMPIINGFETSRKIRELGITTPIIALTAFEKEEVVEEVIASGMNDIIVKPFEPSKLFQIINRQIQKNKLNENIV